MLTSLGKHYDFLRDVLASPPVGPIADALAAMKEAKGAPLLASHLLDPADTEDDVSRAAAALATLATKDELPALLHFFAMYRGTAESDEIGLAVASAGEAILRLDPKDGRALIEPPRRIRPRSPSRAPPRSAPRGGTGRRRSPPTPRESGREAARVSSRRGSA